MLRDELALTGHDPDDSADEDCYITFGISNKGRLLVVGHTERQGMVRIINARRAARGERRIYKES